MASKAQERSGELLFELLHLVAEQMHKSGMDEKVAEETATHICEQLVHRYGGLQFYFPKGKNLFALIKQAEIFQRFNGTNVDQLAIEYNYSVQQIYRVLRKEYKERQGDMFANDEQEDRRSA